ACRRCILSQRCRQRPTRQCQPVPCESLGQQGPCSGQSSRQCPFRTADLPSSLFVGFALQIAQKDGETILVGKVAQLLVQQGFQVMPKVFLDPWCFRHLIYLPLPEPSFGGHPPGLASRLVGHTVQPVPHPLSWLDGSRLAHQNQEGGLKSVFGIVVITK